MKKFTTHPRTFGSQTTPVMKGLGIVILFGLIGWTLLRVSHAATFATASEAENGVLSGNQQIVDDPGASNGRAVLFGATIAPPPPEGTDVTTYGAVCDGKTDDTIKLQSALDATKAGKTLIIPASKSCVHTNVLHIRNAGSRLAGSGTLIATSKDNSSVWVDADNVTVEDVTLKMEVFNAVRTAGDTHQGLYLNHRTGVILRKIFIDGSVGVGIMVKGGSNYLIEDVKVQNTLADGIHNTDGSYNGHIVRPTIINPADDGVAVVSYQNRPGIGVSHDITIDSPKLVGQFSGRGFTVVGGENITYNNIDADSSAGASVYISSESAFHTYGSKNIKVLGGTIKNANTREFANRNSNPCPTCKLDQGAILVSVQGTAADNQPPNQNIDIENIDIIDSRASLPKQVSATSQTGSPSNQRVQFKNIHITRGPSTIFNFNGTDANQYNTSKFTYNGVALPDHTGFTP